MRTWWFASHLFLWSALLRLGADFGRVAVRCGEAYKRVPTCCWSCAGHGYCPVIAFVLSRCPHAMQVHAMLSQLSQFTDIRLALVVGGLSLQSQASALRSNPEIVVATPVRDDASWRDSFCC